MTAGHVVVAAGTWGTQHLLHYAKDAGSLPRMSSALGKLTRTNSESILGAMRSEYKPEQDFSEGVAITSSFHPRSDTHVEPVRYGKGSNAIAVLQTLLTDGGGDTRAGASSSPRSAAIRPCSSSCSICGGGASGP